MHEAGGPSVGRPHLARVLLARGAISNLDEAFDRFVGYGGPCYVPRADAWTPDAVRTIRAAGGRPVLAHPGLLRNSALVLESLLEAGLWGLEARHASHDAAARARYEETAAALGLAITGGTDTHGPGSIHDVPLGTIEVPAATLEALLGKPVGA
jgi:predicted metal-dependent phosphoesterase TrpH